MRLSQLIKWLLVASLGVIVLVCGGIALAFAYCSSSVPEFDSLSDYHPNLTTHLYADDGQEIAELGTESRTLVPLDRIPKHLIQAFIASEDQHFYTHSGFDYGGLAAALFEFVTGQRKAMRGASTLTQQLAKSLLVQNEGYEQGTERSVWRKMKEAILARDLENELSKDDILWMYLNQVYLGHGAWGVQSASQHYFRKDVDKLDLAECTILAGLPQAPSRYSPFVNQRAAANRQLYVLNRMLANGYISAAERKRALAEHVAEKVHPKADLFKDIGPYFSEQVRQYLYKRYGEKTLYTQGLRVETTLNVRRQLAANRSVVEGLHTVDKRQGWRGPVFRLPAAATPQMDGIQLRRFQAEHSYLTDNGLELAQVLSVNTERQYASIAMNGRRGFITRDKIQWTGKKNIQDLLAVRDVVWVKPSRGKEAGSYELEQEPLVEAGLVAMDLKTGYVQALVGGYAFGRSEFNRILQGCRQPGSAFKPIMYAAAISEKQFTPATLVLDAPLTFRSGDEGDSWKPRNFDQSYRGEITLREAVMDSVNSAALRVAQTVGIETIISWAKKLGVDSKLKSELGTAIGSSCVLPIELTRAYAIFARLGEPVDPVYITRVIDRDGRVLEDNRVNRNPPQRVMLEVDAFILNYLLTQVTQFGTAQRASQLGRLVAGKTGTTNDNFDTWFVGYSPSLIAAVWVGTDTMKTPLVAYEQGGRTALPIWMSFMQSALNGMPDEAWTAPPAICWAKIDAQTGLQVTDSRAGSFLAPFRCGTEPGNQNSHESELQDLLKKQGGL